MAFQVRNPDGSEVPAGDASEATSGIGDAALPILIGNDGFEITIAELLRLVPDELSEADRNLLNRIAAYLVDFVLVNDEVWTDATDAQLVALDPNDAAATQAIGLLAAGSVPTLTGWAAEIATTANRVIIARIPLANNAEDYRIHMVQGSTTTDQRLQYLPERARNSQYKFISSLRTERPGTFTAQHHAIEHHTEFGGNIGARGIAQVQALVDALAASVMARLLPDTAGASEGQIAKLNSALQWIIGDDETGGTGGSGLTSAQVAKLAAIATPPAEGARDRKGLIYDGDRTGWEIFDYLTRAEFRDYKPHTPDRGHSLPAYIPPQGTFVLESTSHWSEKLYPFYPIGRSIDINGRTFHDIGTIEVALSSELTIFESSDNPNPAIFSPTRVAGIYMRSAERTATEAGYQWRPKIVMDRALFPSDNGAYDYSGLSIRMRVGYEGIGQYHHASLYHSAFNRDGDELSGVGVINEIVSGGKTYVCFVPDNRNFHWKQFLANAANNGAEVSFQILKSKSASPIFPPTDPQFLSDDPATAWVDGDEFETGLYEGDVNGHPQQRILPPVALWNQVLARTNTIFSGTTPDSRAGVDGQFWVNLRTGQIWQKQSGTWTGIADLVLQTELQAAIDAIEASGGADGRLIFGGTGRPANNVGKVGDAYIRQLTGALGFYEKTGTTTWTYRYEILVLRNRPTINQRDRLGLFWDGNTLGWSEQKAVFAELGISASITIPQEDGTAIPLTYAASLVSDHNATGLIARATAGNAITLKAGSYTIDVDMNVATAASGNNSRSNVEFTIYNGSTQLKMKRGGYLRSLNAYNEQVASTRFTIHFASDTTIQIRVKLHDNDAGDPAITTQAGGTVTVRRIGV